MSNEPDRPSTAGPSPDADTEGSRPQDTPDGIGTGRSKRPAKTRERRVPGPITPEYLFRAATYYVERFATTGANLEKVLARKVARRARARGEAAEGHEDAIAATVRRFVELKLIDDESFAENKLASLRRRGTSARMAAARLAEKGVPRETIEAAMIADPGDDEAAAKAYAKRRRLGPFRLRDRSERRDRDVAAMMRAGFAYGLARAVVDGRAED